MEESKFQKSLAQGMREFEKRFNHVMKSTHKIIPGAKELDWNNPEQTSMFG